LRSTEKWVKQLLNQTLKTIRDLGQHQKRKN
jgi:hypothetical protein